MTDRPETQSGDIAAASEETAVKPPWTQPVLTILNVQETAVAKGFASYEVDAATGPS